MSHASPYQQHRPSPPALHEDEAFAAPPPSHSSTGGLPPAFLASLQTLYPSVSPTSKTAQDIAAYLNGTASISYETRLDNGLQQQQPMNVNAVPAPILQARAIDALLAQAKHAQHSFSGTQPLQQQQQTSLASFGMPNQTYLNPQRGVGAGLAQPIQAPSLPFNLFPYQQYLQQHQQRFGQPQQYNNFTNFHQQQQQQQQANQYEQAPAYPSVPFFAQGDQQSAQFNDLRSSVSTNSTIESPSLPELGQDFIYDPAAFELSGASNDFGDAVSPFSVPSHGPYDFTKSANGGGYAPPQQQQTFDMSSFDQDSPLTSSSPSSSFSPPSPYAFNNIESSLSNSGSEYDFQSCSVSVVGANASASEDNSNLSGGEVEKRKHVCEVCHRGFARAFNLKSHMHTHLPTRYKPFLCPSKDCSRSFSRSHDMERHRSGIHQEGPLAAKAGLIPEDSPLAAPGVKASANKKQRAVRGVLAASAANA